MMRVYDATLQKDIGTTYVFLVGACDKCGAMTFLQPEFHGPSGTFVRNCEILRGPTICDGSVRVFCGIVGVPTGPVTS